MINCWSGYVGHHKPNVGSSGYVNRIAGIGSTFLESALTRMSQKCTS